MARQTEKLVTYASICRFVIVDDFVASGHIEELRYCPHEVSYIIDFSRPVTSPEKRAAWKAQFLQNQPSPAVPAQTKSEMDFDRKNLAEVAAEIAKPRTAKSARE